MRARLPLCQAAYLPPDTRQEIRNCCASGHRDAENTGYEDVTLLSLSTSDYCQLPELLDGLLAYCEERSIGVSLPSLRVRTTSLLILCSVCKR